MFVLCNKLCSLCLFVVIVNMIIVVFEDCIWVMLGR